MSDSELLRIKNKQKASYKSRKTARSNLKILIRPNDRFGLKPYEHVHCRKVGRTMLAILRIACGLRNFLEVKKLKKLRS